MSVLLHECRECDFLLHAKMPSLLVIGRYKIEFDTIIALKLLYSEKKICVVVHQWQNRCQQVHRRIGLWFTANGYSFWNAFGNGINREIDRERLTRNKKNEENARNSKICKFNSHHWCEIGEMSRGVACVCVQCVSKHAAEPRKYILDGIFWISFWYLFNSSLKMDPQPLTQIQCANPMCVTYRKYESVTYGWQQHAKYNLRSSLTDKQTNKQTRKKTRSGNYAKSRQVHAF